MNRDLPQNGAAPSSRPERKSAEADAALTFANRLLQAGIESSPDAVFVVRAEPSAVSYNRHFMMMWSLPWTADAIGDPGSVLPLVLKQIKDSEDFQSDIQRLIADPSAAIHAHEIELKDGRIVEYHGAAIVADDGATLGRIWYFRDITTRRNTERAARAMIRRSHRQLRVIGQVGQADALLTGDVERLAREVAALAAWACECERVGVWLFNDDESELRCIDLYEATPTRHSRGAVLREADYYQEFVLVKKAKYIDAHDAVNDPRTAGYAAGYLEPAGITAMLDAAIQVSGRTFGVLRLEHVGKPHQWDQNEAVFASQLADKIGLAIISRMRRQAEVALQRRDALLHAAARSATELATAPSLDRAIHTSLEIVSKAIQVDRVSVLERPPRRGVPATLRYVWHGPGAAVKLDAAFFNDPLCSSADVVAWQTPLRQGRIVATRTDLAAGPVRELLGRLGIKSVLLVPISVDDRYWGQVSFDSCARERMWPDYEVEILKSLADLIGTAIQRDRHVKEIADANRIVQNTPTILYRMRGEAALPMIYVSGNIRLLGHEAATLLAAPLLYKDLVHPDDAARLETAMTRALADQGQRGTVEFRLRTGGGDYRWLENRFTPIRDAAGRLVEIEGLLIDVTERKAAEERIALLARTDALTGLANRNTFDERLRQAFAAAQRGAPPFAVLYLDVDRFKDVNDTHGHPLGDRLLVEIAHRIEAAVRDTDLVARLGGDEFAVLQCDLAGTADAGALATKLCGLLAEPVDAEGTELRVSASIGISVYTPETRAPDDLLAHADVALYRAKEEGRNQYRFHSDALDEQVREDVRLAEELRAGLARGEMELTFRPQVETGTGRVAGMKALVRWRHPTRGPLLPQAFGRIAERTGTMAAIGRWAIERACDQLGRWRAAGEGPPCVAVDVSPSELRSTTEFIAFVTETLAKCRLEPGDLELVVTEATLARLELMQNDVLQRLRRIGVAVAIGDFGMESSTLDRLRSYRVSRLEVPRRLVDAAAYDTICAATLRATAAVAREFGMDIVVDGSIDEAVWTANDAAPRAVRLHLTEPVADSVADRPETRHSTLRADRKESV